MPRLSCQSGVWKKNHKVDDPIRRAGSAGNIYGDAGIAYCHNDEIVVGGGGFCTEPSRHYIHDSFPVSAGEWTPYGVPYQAAADGWYVNCVGVPGYADLAASAFAICMKKQ